MNAPTKITNKRQSLDHQCRDRRHSLLQLFAQAEMLMASRLGKDCPKMFGEKLKTVSKTIEFKKAWASLTDARNLLAHAFVEIFENDGQWT